MKIEVPKGYLILRCEFCKQDLAMFKPGRLKVPLDASMFEPLPVRRGSAYSIWPGKMTEWKDAQCPFHSVMNNGMIIPGLPWLAENKSGPVRVYTPNGFYFIGSTQIPQKQREMTLSERNQILIEEEEQRLRDIAEAKKSEVQALKDEIKAIEDTISDYHKLQANTENIVFPCPYCEKTYKYEKSRDNHEIECPENPNNKKMEVLS